MSTVTSETVPAAPVVVPPAEPVGNPSKRLWTIDEYYHLGELGLFQDQRVELIEGEVLLMSPQGDPHIAAVELVKRTLDKVFDARYWVRTQAPLHLPNRSAPEPDVAVVLGNPRTVGTRQAKALLVVEISAATLAFDRRRKSSLYASVGVEEYWVLNLLASQLEVHRRPQPDAGQKIGYGYAEIVIVAADGSVSPLAAPHAKIAVADLLP